MNEGVKDKHSGEKMKSEGKTTPSTQSRSAAHRSQLAVTQSPDQDHKVHTVTNSPHAPNAFAHSTLTEQPILHFRNYCSFRFCRFGKFGGQIGQIFFLSSS